MRNTRSTRSALSHPSGLLADAELRRWNTIRNDVALDLDADFPQAARLARQYFANNVDPSFPELVPLFLRKTSDITCAPYDKAWLLLYVASAVLDDLQDGDIPNSKNNSQAVQTLSIVAASRATRVFGAVFDDVESTLRRSLFGQSMNLTELSGDDQVNFAAKEKNALLSLPNSIPKNSVYLNAGSQDALQFVVQAMDDITDINLDANAGVQTTVCQQSFMGLTEDRVIYEACCGERIHKVLDRVNDQCDLLILQVNGEKCPFRDFLNEVAFACMDIGDRANKVRGAGSYKSAKKYIGEMKEAISVYAIAS